ncbi:prepilin peptidase [Kitasatospora sp. NPDC089509]|uniref:prepilin peptidase n=1 Tax=Kitasatospora sp. NPDC089509 TaxID=3364079 RepID=UPI0037F88C36
MVVVMVTGAVLVGLLLAPLLRGLIARFAVPEGEPRCGACPLCGRAVGLLLPPSGRCPGCRGRLGAGAGTVEAVTAAVAVGVAYAADGAAVAALAWAGALGVALGFTDVRVRRLPYRLTGPLLAGVAVLLTVAALAEGRPGVLLRCLLVALAVGALLEVAVQVGALGPGDSPLGFVLGGLLGWYGWWVAIGGLVAAVVLAGLWGTLRALALLVRRRPWRGLDVPVGPFLLLGALTAVLAR